MRRAYKYRLFTNRNQERELGIMLESHRRLYNACLEQRKVGYETDKQSVKYTEQSAWFKTERTRNLYFARLNFSSAQATMRRLEKAYKNFFRRVKQGSEKPGFPRFKARDRFDSIEFPAYGDGIRLHETKLRVQNVGVIRTRVHRPHEGVVKTATLKLEASKWYVILSCDLGEVSIPPSQNPPVGIDVGLEHFFTTNEGEHIANPRFLKEQLPELRRCQRSVSRQKKGSKKRRKAVAKVSKLHTRVRNVRREYHYQIVNRLIDRYGLFAVERLNIRGMLRNHRLAKAISDVGWYNFRMILAHKAESAGAVVIEVNPAGTSQFCAECGVEVRKELSDRWHSCDCGYSVHRDINAARNILLRALAWTGLAGPNADVSLHVLGSRRL